MGLAPPVQLQAVHVSTRQASRQGSRFGSMTNPTDTGGENPTIRDVSPPSDTQPATGVTYPDSRLEALLAVLLVVDTP